MRRNTRNPERPRRSKEEIEARRAERRRIYEELEAFERDLPDFIFEENDIRMPDTEEPDIMQEDIQEEEAFQETEESFEAEEEEPETEEIFDEAKEVPVSNGMDWILLMEEAERIGEEMEQDTAETQLLGRKNGSTKSRYTGPKNPDADQSVSWPVRSGNSRSGNVRRGQRRRKKNRLPLILAGTAMAVLIIGGAGILKKFGIIGGKELYEVYINDTLVGTVENPDICRDMYLQVRREIVSNSMDTVLMEADYAVQKKDSFVKVPSDPAELQAEMKKALEEAVVGTLDKNYAVKINDFIVHLDDKTEVVDLLEAVKSPYDEQNEYAVQLVTDTTRELSVLTTQVVRSEAASDIGGMVELPTEEISSEETENGEDDGTLPQVVGDSDGLKEVSFVENIEIAESYVSTANIVSAEEAAAEITKEKEESQIYEVVSGDSLSVVAQKNGLKMAKLLELNPHLSESSVLHIGDQITITVPQPELSVITKVETTYEEDYEAPVQYVDNDSWYTTKQVVKQEPVTGHRKVTAIVTYNNGKETGREFIAETVMTAAVPKIVERGTQTPPTYIKPLSGGRLSSGYKYRWGRWHRGVDWACPTGTTIFASCGGTVSSAGWSSSYGYVITISHPDGRQTRYAHLSKILVSSGQKVKQGQKIALSGNTGRSTGPHLHFEIIINGSKVNPMKYLQ